MERIAVLGLGRMGAAAARRLLADGRPVSVWNRTPAPATRLAAEGADVAVDPAQAVRDADAVVVFVSDADAVREVLFGPSGAAAAMRPGAVLLQMSTIGPEAVDEVKRRLPEGVRLLDAPVKGSVPHVVTGALTVYVGGEPDDVDRAGPVLSALGTTVRCGGVGAASALKLVVNAAMITSVACLAEAFGLAAALGVSEEGVREELRSGPLAGALARVGAAGVDFPVTHAIKDLDLATASAPYAGLDVVAAVRNRLADFMGDPADDLSAVVDGK
ncbi:MAG: NAD(P)-dependent oxidoreductase [Stackebrandtia sp.]